VFLICSDGFRNKITNDEIYEYLNPNILSDTIIMKQNIDYLIKLNKDRNETDNISVIAVRTYGD
jgi:serine/threonine protein phosphatase PrpC